MTCISPGPVDTPFHLGRSFGGTAGEHKPAAAALKVEDVVRALVWVLDSPDHVDVNDIVLRALPLAVSAADGASDK